MLQNLKRGRFDAMALAAGADDQGGGIAHRKTFRADEDPVIGRSVPGKIDHGVALSRLPGDRDQCRGRVAFAGAGFGRVDIVDDGEVRRVRTVRDLDPDGGPAGIGGATRICEAAAIPPGSPPITTTRSLIDGRLGVGAGRFP